MSKRRGMFLAMLVVLVAGPACATPKPAGEMAATRPGAVRRIRPTGLAMPELVSFDRVMIDLMTRWEIHGASVAVVKDGRLVLARGYGLADVDRRRAVRPDSLFRIASLSKPITSAAALKLVEEGQLDLDAKAFDILKRLEPPKDSQIDPRIQTVTVRQLLHHSGGWDWAKSFDPMFQPWTRRAAEALGVPPPVGPDAIVRFMLGKPLDFDPGSRYAYSNFGYCVLGRVIEAVTGQPYERYVQTHVLQPMGIRRMQIGRSRPADRASHEVRYYERPDAKPVRSVFATRPYRVPYPDGGFYLEALDAHGGWIASAVDLVRFVAALDGRGDHPPFLKDQTKRLMLARPAPPLWVGTSHYYAMGWMVRPKDNDANWWHNGSLPGIRSLLVRTYHGMVWAALFNTTPKKSKPFEPELDRGMWIAVSQVRSWPDHDLFERYR